MSSLSAIRDGRLADRRVLDDGRLARALQALDGQGEETRLVGGAVRDLALGEKAGDFDLATTALPAQRWRRSGDWRRPVRRSICRRTIPNLRLVSRSVVWSQRLDRRNWPRAAE